MSSKPLSFHDLPAEVRNLIYHYAVICDDEFIEPGAKGTWVWRREISHATGFLKVSKVINKEATPVFYANHLFCFNKISSVIGFISKIGKQNASHIKLLNLGSTFYSDWEAQTTAPCKKSAFKDAAKTLGRFCTGLELLDCLPDVTMYPRYWRKDDTPFKYWTDHAFVAVKALTVAFPRLDYVSYDHGGGGESVRLTSIKAMQVAGEVRSTVHNRGKQKLTNVRRTYPSTSMRRLGQSFT
jgi:hypothetical protein